MKRILQIIFIVVAIFNVSYSQWFWQNPLPQGNNLISVYFIENNGWAVGASGTIIKTTDAGAMWMNKISNTSVPLISVFFISLNEGWATGGSWDTGGMVLKTTDGGENWSVILTGTPAYIYDVHFISSTNGWAVGWAAGDGIIVKSTDGGISWNIRSKTFKFWTGAGMGMLTGTLLSIEIEQVNRYIG